MSSLLEKGARAPGDLGVPMPAREQVARARLQLLTAPLDLQKGHWLIHERDLAQLRRAIGLASSLFAIRFACSNSDFLLAKGPQLIWIEEEGQEASSQLASAATPQLDT